jgi:hypothetical protein
MEWTSVELFDCSIRPDRLTRSSPLQALAAMPHASSQNCRKLVETVSHMESREFTAEDTAGSYLLCYRQRPADGAVSWEFTVVRAQHRHRFEQFCHTPSPHRFRNVCEIGSGCLTYHPLHIRRPFRFESSFITRLVHSKSSIKPPLTVPAQIPSAALMTSTAAP